MIILPVIEGAAVGMVVVGDLDGIVDGKCVGAAVTKITKKNILQLFENYGKQKIFISAFQAISTVYQRQIYSTKKKIFFLIKLFEIIQNAFGKQ